MDHGVDIAALDRDTARLDGESETGLATDGLAKNRLASVDALMKGAQRPLAAHGQILTGADFARAGQLDERLDTVFEQLADTYATLPAVISDGQVWT